VTPVRPAVPSGQYVLRLLNATASVTPTFGSWLNMVDIFFGRITPDPSGSSRWSVVAVNGDHQRSDRRICGRRSVNGGRGFARLGHGDESLGLRRDVVPTAGGAGASAVRWGGGPVESRMLLPSRRPSSVYAENCPASNH
jgi:hypothetical protein